MDVVIAGTQIRPGQGNLYCGGMKHRAEAPTEPYVTRMARVREEAAYWSTRCGLPTRTDEPCSAGKAKESPACVGHTRPLAAIVTALLYGPVGA